MNAHDARGQRRRAELVEAGVAILAEDGSDALTHRAVAARAGANAGLVHYYFKGTRGLRFEVAAEACQRSIGAVFDRVLLADDFGQMWDNISAVLAAAGDDPAAGRLSAEVASAAFGDGDIGELVRQELRRGRGRLEDWLRAQDESTTPEQARGTAAVLAAAVDGLVLHLVLDPELPVRDVEHAFRRIGGRPQAEDDPRGTYT